MDLKSAIDIILRDLNEAGELIEDLKNKPEFPELQVELIKSKCKSAEDLIKIVGEILAQTDDRFAAAKEAKPEAVPDIVPEPSVPENKVLELDETDVGHQEEEEEKVEEEEKMEKEDKMHEARNEKIVADRFTHLSSRMNEKVGDSKKMEGKTRTMPVTDLYKALGINDRFFYIRELFDGKEEPFRQVISGLNDASTIDEAEDILREMLKEKADSEPATQLLELVQRKLSGR